MKGLVAAPAGLAKYEAARHFADARTVTRLSAYVHHGQLSARLLAVRASIAPGTALAIHPHVGSLRGLRAGPDRSSRAAGLGLVWPF